VLTMGEVVLAACTDDQGILATDLRSGALVATFEESAAQPHAFGALGEGSGYIYVVQAKKALWHVWGWGDRKPSYRASLPEKMTAMTFSTNAVLSFGGSASGSIYVWQMGTGCLLRCWPAHFREVTQLVVSEDESFLVSASADSTVHVYNMADIFAEQAAPRPFRSWSGHALAVTSLALLPGSGLQQVVASASLDRTVRLWDVGSGRQVTTRTLAEPVHSICTGPAGTELFCACGGGDLRSLSITCGPGEGGGLYTGHVGTVLSCALCADGSQVASCSEVDRVRIWETRTRQCVSQLHGSRNVQIGAVRIVQRTVHAARLPPFQPFQRLLTPPQDAPPVPLCTGGRAAALRQAMEPCASTHDFVDRVLWGQAADLEALAKARELEAQLSVARAEQARWAQAAADLYDALLEEGRGTPATDPEEGEAEAGEEVTSNSEPPATKRRRRRAPQK